VRVHLVLVVIGLLGLTTGLARAEGRPVPPPSTVAVSLTVDPVPWGTSTHYIGGTEGNMGFDPRDFADCGVNTLRVYGDMSRFEPEDDDGAYGSPSPAEVQADPNRIPWGRWDAAMDGLYSDQITRTPPLTWRGVFADLKRGGVRVVISLRNRDAPNLNPKWMAAVPTTEADWNEWWEYVFAMAYWLNVRNDFRVDDYEVLNEPDNTPQQGWLGTREQYAEMVVKTKEALDFVYRTYLPGRAYHVHAPVTAGPEWVPGVLADAGSSFDSLNAHWYSWWDQGECVRGLHRALKESGHPEYPIWLSEWGSYDTSYDIVWMGLALVDGLIRFSQPGDDAVYGSHVFSFYDWHDDSGSGSAGLVKRDGSRRRGYYALRLATRALRDGKPTYQVRFGAPASDLRAIATREHGGRVNLLVMNWAETTSYVVTADLRGLVAAGRGRIRHYSATAKDEVVGETEVVAGRSRFAVPPFSAVLVTYRRQGTATAD
jgi:hypothetical protein